MGGADVSDRIETIAHELGEQIAGNGWILVCGGRNSGVMRAVAQGAKKRNGMTIGILPGKNKSEANPFIDIAIPTNMGDARNVINVLASDVVIACQGSAGTLSEIALALKIGKPVILLEFGDTAAFSRYLENGQLISAENVDHCIRMIKEKIG